MKIPSLAHYLKLTESFDTGSNDGTHGLLQSISNDIISFYNKLRAARLGHNPSDAFPFELVPGLQRVLAEVESINDNLRNVDFQYRHIFASRNILDELAEEVRLFIANQPHQVPASPEGSALSPKCGNHH